MNKFGRSLPSAQEKIKIMQVQTPDLITLTKDGEYTIQNHRLCNIKTPTDDSDAANKGFVENAIIAYKTQINQSLRELHQKLKSSIDNISIQ